MRAMIGDMTNLVGGKMTHPVFLQRVIDEGIEAARSDYNKDSDKARLEGSVAGFEACRDKTPSELFKVLQGAYKATDEAYGGDTERYWSIRCFAEEVEWVCNVVSVVLAAEGSPVLVTPTHRGVLKANQILMSDGCHMPFSEFRKESLDFSPESAM